MNRRTAVQPQKQPNTPLASGILQRAGVCSVAEHAVPPIVYEVLRSPGRPLNPGLRAFMESGFGQDFSRVRMHSIAPTMAQCKLTIGQIGDAYEQEADRIADRVTQMTDSGREERLSRNLRRSAANPTESFPVPPIVHEVLRSPGKPLDPETRAFFEPRFGHDFSRVRIHTDAKAEESARAVNALAYTMARDVVFAAGQYKPSTGKGQRLLAHELTHVVQNSLSLTESTKTPLTLDSSSKHENEAQVASEAVVTRHPARVTEIVNAGQIQLQPKEPPLTADAAGGCGICYRGDVKAVGLDAHTQIMQDFEIMYPMLLTQLPIAIPEKTKIISKGVPDLLLPTPTGFKVGEIKPANPEGYVEGEAKLTIYEGLLRELFGKINPNIVVERLDLKPPPPFPYIEPASLTCTQLLIVGPSVRGVYGYLCQPPFSYELRKRCQCEGEKKPPPPVKVKERSKERYKPEERIGPEVLVPVGLTALVVLMAKFAARRVTAPASAVAALILIARGAEASIGFEGEDPLEALFRSAKSKGIEVPDDLKEAIKADPDLKRIFAEAAQTGDMTTAQQALGERLMRIIMENRDQFTEEELKELLKVTKENKNAIPNYEPTVENIQQALEAAKARGEKSGTPTEGPLEFPGEGALKIPELAEAPKPVQRLVRGVVRAEGKGPRVDASVIRELLKVATLPPPLSDADVDILLERATSAEGKTAAEVVKSIRKAILQLQKMKRGKRPSEEAVEPKKERVKKEREKRGKVGVSSARAIDKTKKGTPQPSDKEMGKKYMQALKVDEKRLDRGQAALLFPDPSVVLVEGKPISGVVYLLGRDENGVPYMGQVAVKAEKKVKRKLWSVTISEGAKLYNSVGNVYGTSRRYTDTIEWQ